ncbi:MAG TPA: hypothetical protein VHZ77_09305 [Gaiellaceae bacterium]|nr:hypothetical protein [Gaiellaceae bacterium]
MADVPDGLVLKRNRDLEGVRRGGIWVRRAFLALIAVVAALGLANVFGQRPSTVRADVPAATISVYAPTAIRGGDFMEARFHITAKRDLKQAILKLDPGWGEGMSMNTVEPSPVSESSDDGRLAFDLGHIAAGHSSILFLQFQVNPTNVAWHRPQNVELADGDQVIARLHRTITVFP